MGFENDMTIFKYLNPMDNDMLSMMTKKDINEILLYLDRYYLEYRNLLGISSDITFGMEIEMEHFKGGVADFWPFEVEINRIVGNNDWTVKNDITLTWGRELATEIYNDSIKTWEDIRNVCEFCQLYGEIGIKCAGHINIGSQIFGNESLYWYRFLKLWGIYENIIYRFGYGEYLTHFPFISYSAKPLAKVISDKMDLFESKINMGAFDVLNCLFDRGTNIDFLKKNAVSFLMMYNFENYNVLQENCRVEIRNFLGTLDEIIWQNNVYFIVSLMLYCKNDKFDEDILNKRRLEVDGIFGDLDAYSKVYLDQALELSDLIFNNNIDKIYFLRQYLKSFEVGDKCFVKARKFTFKNCFDSKI